MNTLSCIIVDDEPLAIDLLERYVGRTPFLDLKGSFSSAIEAMQTIHSEHIDL
ncbi:MAG: DNA-binding response regulator, partial [Bacteroidales bacterium]|nr:DNA-binding response regulator [Bacteroidales bacterium]